MNSRTLSWAGFQGSEKELSAWLRGLKTWAERFARRRRRPELTGDCESAALSYLAEHGLIGSALTPEIERHVTRALDLGDAFSTARDSDLTANLNERMKERDMTASFLETAIADPHTEDDLLSVLDGEPRVEGRDLSEIQDEIEALDRWLDPIVEASLDLKHSHGLRAREIARFLGVSYWELRYRRRKGIEQARIFQELSALQAEWKARPQLTEIDTRLEVAWITI